MSGPRASDRRRHVAALLVTAGPWPSASGGDPLPFAPAEGRWQDGLALGVAVLLVAAVTVVALRLVRAPADADATREDPAGPPAGS